MKRSAMLENIASELVRQELEFPPFSLCLLMAEYILARMEKEGMLPPEQEIPEFKHSAPNQWEPEDE